MVTTDFVTGAARYFLIAPAGLTQLPVRSRLRIEPITTGGRVVRLPAQLRRRRREVDLMRGKFRSRPTPG